MEDSPTLTLPEVERRIAPVLAVIFYIMVLLTVHACVPEDKHDSVPAYQSRR